MSKLSSSAFWLAAVVPLIVAAGCGGETGSDSESNDAIIEQVNAGALTMAQGESACRCGLEAVRVSGTVFHFGLDLSQNPPAPFPFQSTVAGTRVSIGELPATRTLNLRSDADGRWAIVIVKRKQHPLPISFVYERAGYVVTKSQQMQLGDADLLDVAIQLPTAAYFAAAKGQIEQQIGALIGAPYTLSNVLVTTVGKSWASMYNPDLPHGDPGAQVSMQPAFTFPASVGPIYFNAAVAPDPTLTSTSVDGGVMFGNLSAGSHVVTASKAPFSYSQLTFVVEDGIPLYVASPPHATQGTNSSPPGQP